MIKLRENNTHFNEKKDNQFYYVIKHSQVECTQKALILYMTRESEQRFDVSEKITVFLFLFSQNLQALL